MSIREPPEISRYLTARAALVPPPRVGRRDQVEAVGLLLGILVILVVVVVTLGATPGLA
jgi:hypothetical protein